MPSAFWYLGLAVIGVGAAVFTACKKRKHIKIAELTALYMFATSITYVGEFLALVVFKGYEYRPGIIADPFGDNVLGHLIINSTLWPGTALLVVAFSLGYGSISVITLGYIFAELLFVKLGIYEQLWWKYYMSVIVVFAFHAIVKLWYNKLLRTRSRLPGYITFYFIARVIVATPVTLLLYLGRLHYDAGLAENMYEDSILFFVIYHFGMSLLYVFFAYGPKKWFWKLVPVLGFLLGDLLLVRLDILIFKSGYSLIYSALVNLASLTLFILTDKCTRNTPINSYGSGRSLFIRR